MKPPHIRGFTLIELMLVISIIALLSLLIFSALNIARAKSIDAKTRVTLGDIRSQANIDRNSTGSYSDTFTSPNGTSYVSLLTYANQQNVSSTQYAFRAGTDEFVVVFPLKSKMGYWCVDGNGISKEVAGMPNATPPYNCDNIAAGGSGSNTLPVITLHAVGPSGSFGVTDNVWNCSITHHYNDIPFPNSNWTYEANDAEDGNITNNVIISYENYTSPGCFDVRYSVTDSGGLNTQAVRTHIGDI